MAAIRAAAEPPAAIEAARAPVTLRKTLPSGLRLIVREMPGASTTALELRVRAGSAFDDPQKPGAAHFLEHLVFKGAGERLPGSADREIEAVGGELDARTARDWTRFSVTLPGGSGQDTAWQTALATLADIVQSPALRQTDIDAERAVIRAETALAQSEPMRQGYAALFAAAYGTGDPQGLPLLGTTKGIADLTSDDLRAVWKRQYLPGNLTLVIAGDVRAADVSRVVEERFPVLASSASPGEAATVAVAIAPPNGIVRAPSPGPTITRELTTVLLAFRVPGAEDPEEMPVLEVLATLLADGDTGTGGGRGRLVESLVEKRRLAVAVSSEYLPGKTGGLLILSATGPAGRAAPLEAGLVAELERMREDVPGDDEVARARGANLAGLRYDDQAPTGVARRLSLLDALGVPPAVADAYAERLGAVSVEAVRRTARALTLGRYTVAVIGPAAATTTTTATGETTP